MTIDPPPRSQPPAPPRSGEPWTTDDYEALLRLAREGVSVEETSRALGRSPVAVRSRARRLLPLDERGMPTDRVLPHLGELARADEDYPWTAHLAATPPPRPVVEHVWPAPRYAGVAGLGDQQLVLVATLLALGPAGPETIALGSEVATAVVERGLTQRVREASERHALDLAGSFLELSSSWEPMCREELGWDPTGWSGLDDYPPT